MRLYTHKKKQMLKHKKHIILRIITLIAGVILLQFKAEAQQSRYVTAGDVAGLRSAMNAANSGDIIYIPGGTYNLAATGAWGTSALQLKAGVTLVGGYNTPGVKTVFDKANDGNTGATMSITTGGDTARVKNITFTMQGRSSVWVNGGAISAEGVNVKAVIEDCEFLNMSTGNRGGGLHIGYGAFVRAVNCTLNGCDAQNGGAAYIDRNTTLILEGCIISNNTSRNGGGAFYVSCPATLVITHSTVTGNTDLGGWGVGGIGGINLEGLNCVVSVTSSVVSGNSSMNAGGNLMGNDIPNNNNVEVENSIVGDSLVVSNDREHPCRLDNSCFHPGVEVETDPETGEITIVLPPEAPNIPDLGGGNTTIIADQGNNPPTLEFRRDTVHYSNNDSLICFGDSMYFQIRLCNYDQGGNPQFTLFRTFPTPETQILTTTVNKSQSGCPNTWTKVAIKPLPTSVIERYQARMSNSQTQGNGAIQSEEIRIIILPETSSGEIRHTKNTNE
jgi:hypothetical protein